MLFSQVNSALYTNTFRPVNVLVQRAYLAAARRTRPKRQFRTYFGDYLQGDIGDFVQSRIYSFGIWEPNLSRFVESRIQPDTWAVDVGAHVGYFSLLMSRLAPRGHVTAIEASPSTFSQLTDHIAANRRTNVTAVNRAVATKPGMVKLYESKWGAGNTGNNSLIASGPGAPHVTVPADRLLSILGEDARRVSFIKIDVEGAERPILQEILVNRHRFADRLTIVAEVCDANLHLVNWFLSAGFKASVLDNHYGLDAYLSRRQAEPKPWTGAGKKHPSADLIFERF